MLIEQIQAVTLKRHQQIAHALQGNSKLMLRFENTTVSVSTEHTTISHIEIISLEKPETFCLFSDTRILDFGNYYWEFMDSLTGRVVRSELDITASDEDVLRFFEQAREELV